MYVFYKPAVAMLTAILLSTADARSPAQERSGSAPTNGVETVSLATVYGPFYCRADAEDEADYWERRSYCTTVYKRHGYWYVRVYCCEN